MNEIAIGGDYPCPHCGETLDLSHCPYCGKSLSGEKEPSSASVDSPRQNMLLPCPFCGKPPTSTNAGTVWCKTDDCLMGWHTTLVASWNRRVGQSVSDGNENQPPPRVSEEVPASVKATGQKELSVILDEIEAHWGSGTMPYYFAVCADVVKIVKALRRAMEGFAKILNDSHSGCENQDCLYCGGVNEEADHAHQDITAILTESDKASGEKEA